MDGASTFCLVLLLLGATAGAAGAQGRSFMLARALQCTADDPGGDRLGRRVLSNGTTVAVSRATGRDGAGDACTATVRDRGGRIVKTVAGFGVRVDSATGLDIDGDGRPDLVLRIDTGGGNSCCWTYLAMTLASPPRALFSFQQQGGVDFRAEARGGATIWSWEGGFPGADGTMADRLFALRVYQWSGGTLGDVTSRHCTEILPDSLHAQKLRDLASVSSASERADAVQELMLQDVYCERFDQALSVASEAWPGADRNGFLARFRQMVVAANPRYAEPMRNWP